MSERMTDLLVGHTDWSGDAFANDARARKLGKSLEARIRRQRGTVGTRKLADG